MPPPCLLSMGPRFRGDDVVVWGLPGAGRLLCNGDTPTPQRRYGLLHHRCGRFLGRGIDAVGPTEFWSLSTLRTLHPTTDGFIPGFIPGYLQSGHIPIENLEMNTTQYLYKIFSPSPPTSAWLGRLLGFPQAPHAAISDKDISWIYRKVWNSYPYEYPRVTFEEIQLGEALWYTSGIESFISTMETSALMGKNVARLVVDQMVGRIGG